MLEELLKIENVVKFYPPNLRAVNDVSLSVKENEFIAIYGSSGSGKTTLIRLIGGVEKPDAGEIFLFGIPLSTVSESKLSLFRAENIGVITKDSGLIKELTVYANVTLPFHIRNIPKSEYAKPAAELLKTLGLFNVRHSVAGQITPYQRCLTGMARTILTKPKLLLIDKFDYCLSAEESQKAWDILNVILTHLKITVIFFNDKKIEKRKFDRTFKIYKGTLKEVSK